jgi:hypothetical protein
LSSSFEYCGAFCSSISMDLCVDEFKLRDCPKSRMRIVFFCAQHYLTTA